MKRLLGLLALFSLGAFAQGVQQVLPNPDCQIFFSLTATGANSAVQDNRQQGCTSWSFSYTNSGFSAVMLTLQSAANNAGVPGSYSTGFPVQQTVVSGSNPGTSTTAGFFWVQGVNAFVRMHLVATGSGIVQGAVFGWRIPNAASQGGTSGAITCLSGDVTAGTGGGCTAATVVGLESVPFCSGYTPTNGQFVKYTTGGSPNPCYTAAAASSSTGNAASIVTYTPGASVTLTCPSATAGTATVFDPGGVAMAANETFSFASCTAGQTVIVRVLQAASGGPFTVSGLPTGSQQPSTYPSATTVYSLSAVTATTMSYVGVAADSGGSTLGSGASGISRTITVGAGGVTAGLLAAKDASNPTRYQTAGSGGCGSGVAAYTATSGNTSELYTVPGTVLSMVADNAITAGHVLVGGTVTPGRVSDSGQTTRTAVALGTCIVGIALQTQGSAGGAVLVAYDGTGIYGAGAASSVAWNAITNPTGNLSLTMAANTSTWTYNATTGSADLWLLTDTASNTGTGYMARFDTAASSTLKPFHVGAAGVDAISTNASGQVGVNTATPALGMFLVASTVNTTPRGISSGQWSTDTASARFNGYKARGTQASPTVVVTGDFVSRWSAFPYDGSNFLECASIVMSVQGTVASTRTPGQIDLATCTDAAPSVLTTAMTIDKSQRVGLIAGGTPALPGIWFRADNTTGIYQDTANVVRISLAGVRTASFVTSGLQLLGASSAATPALSVDAAANSGLFYPSTTGVVGFSSSGFEAMRISPTGGNTLRVQDLKTSTGATRVLIDLGAADSSSTLTFTNNGVTKSAGYQASDGTAGATTTCTILSITTITVKNGLVTGCS